MKKSTENRSNQLATSERRQFLKAGLASGAAIAAGAAGGLSATPVLADDFAANDPDASSTSSTRLRAVYRQRIGAARSRLRETLRLPDQFDNDDERRYQHDRYYASYSKALPCNRFGEVNPYPFEQLKRAMRNGRKAAFDAIPLASSATRMLTGPQGAFRTEISGMDSHATRINPAWQFRSAELAGELAEVYWQAHTRDVPFIDYSADPTVAAAVSDLNSFARTPGVLDVTGQLTPATLFRGETPGDLVGPYISQFLLRPFQWGPVAVTQRYASPVAGNEFMVDAANWLNVQRGAVAESVSATQEKYIHDNRSLAEAVHNDALYQYYLHATLILLGAVPAEDNYGAGKLDGGNPYSNGSIANQQAFTSLGGPNIIDLVSKAANSALSGAWFQKWRVHRFLRPEAMGGRVHFHKTGQRQYELHQDLLDSEAINRAFTANGSYFLSQAYPEGSPTHPSYVAGHAAVAGACVTVLKACFNEDFLLSDNVQSDATGDQLIPWAGELTIGDELNKLANNISLGRDAAGVHYRQDGIQGLRAGEQQAIALLKETSETFNETDFGGYTLRKFDGTQVSIRDGEEV